MSATSDRDTGGAGATNPFTLAVSSEMVFLDLPHLERVRRIHGLGFAVEIWDWTTKDVDALAGLAQEGVRFTSMTGYVSGRLADREGADELLHTAEQSVARRARSAIPCSTCTARDWTAAGCRSTQPTGSPAPCG